MPLENFLKILEEDHLSGASILMQQAAKALKDLLMAKQQDEEGLYDLLLELGKQIMRTRPHMACLINLIDDLLYIYRKSHTITECITFLNTIRHELMLPYEASAKELFGVKNVLTHSYSSSIFFFLKSLKRLVPDLHVIVTESRPLNEGVRLAEALLEEKISVTYVTDAAALTALQAADVLLLGADFIAKKSFSNKVGSLALALGAKKFKKPLYIVGDSSKYIGIKNAILLKNKFPKEEVLEHNHLQVANPYFESIPTKHIKKILTPEGAFSLNQAQKHLFKKHLHNKALIKKLLT